MKQINEYISIKANKVHKLSHIKLPNNPSFYDYVDFLKKNEFKEIVDNFHQTSFDQFKENLANSKYPLFMMRQSMEKVKYLFDHNEERNEYVMFCNVGEISKENPLFFVRLTGDGSEVNIYKYGVGNAGFIQYDENAIHHNFFYKYEKLKNEIEKYF